jgi:hypothetical protein
VSRDVAYVSDEYFVAVAGADVELVAGDVAVIVRSSPSGAVRAELEPGTYDVVVAKEGYGVKRSRIVVGPDEPPHQLRLLADARPLGYLWPKHVRAGERAELRVHAHEAFRARLFRYGWTRELVEELGLYADLHPAGALRQLVPDGDFTQTGVRWKPSPLGPRQHVEAPDRSGLYYVHVKTESGAFTSFPWVVAPRAPRAPLAVLASTFTWNAYNDFGGRSNYVAMDRLPPQPSVSLRQEDVWYPPAGFEKWAMRGYAPLSLDRPEPLNAVGEHDEITDPIEPLGSEHVAPAEWRLLGWLEREGFAYDLYAEPQLDDGTLPLDEYRVLLLSTHPEYWTRGMFERVRDWVEAGGRLVYLGGNGIDCEVELDGSTMTVLNGEARTWIGAEENRFAARGEPAGALLGVVTTMAGMGTAAPYRVLEPGHWTFDGTGLAAGELFGLASLDVRNPGGASGHETDKLSRHAPAGAVLLARGVNADGGGADMTYVENERGGRVFSVGSISYVCSLPVDPHISRITANVLHRFLDGVR